MNHSKLFLLTGALLACASSSTVNAMTRQDGLSACAEALVDNLGAPAGAAPAYRLDEDSDGGAKRMTRRETVYLDARDPVSGAVVGRYDCVVSRRAEVLELKVLPLDAADARSRSVGSE